MLQVHDFLVPEHGLQVEETLAAGDAQGAIHLARYWWAWQHVKGRVWDLGCGCGYGTRILCEQKPNVSAVIGVDMERRGILLARSEFNHPLTEYVQADVGGFDWPTELDAPADVVVCFELLNRLSNPAVFLETLIKRMAPDGKFLLSLPLSDTGDFTSAVRVYPRKLIFALLARYFARVENVSAADSATLLLAPGAIAGLIKCDELRV